MADDRDRSGHFDVLIIGAGLSGIGAAYQLQSELPGKTYALLESRESMGGTWGFFNYPGFRSDTDMQTLGALKASFKDMGEVMPGFDAVAKLRYPEVERINHVHHAGNSSGIVDGAAALLIGDRDFGVRHGLEPRARIKATAKVGTDPTIMLTGPVPATERVLKAAGMEIGDIDLFEVNEAFSAVVLRFLQAFDLDPGLVIVNGGAIAMGHPLGATGAMILGTALDELERSDKETALATLCVASGMGAATIIERV